MMKIIKGFVKYDSFKQLSYASTKLYTTDNVVVPEFQMDRDMCDDPTGYRHEVIILICD